VNLSVTNIPGCTGRNAKTLGRQHCIFLDMGAGGGPPIGTCIVHHGTDELNTIPDGETVYTIQERSQRSQSLYIFLSYVIDIFRPGEPFIEGHSKITGEIDPLNWFPEEMNRSNFPGAPTGLGEEHCRALRDIGGDPPLSQTPL
jgi:hypothetical protein